MEGYLETLITVLLGLGAFLISTLRKRKPKEDSGGDSVIEDWFQDDNDLDETANDNQISFSKEDPKEIEKENSTLFEKYENIESINLKQTAMRETTSINDPPGLFKNDHKYSEISERGIYDQKEQKKTKRTRRFDGKKAIIYSAIINRKHF